MLEVRIAGGIGEPTGGRLVEKLTELGVDVRGSVGSSSREATARVYWGLCGADCAKPALNKFARRDDKLQELETFSDHGIPCPKYYHRPPSRTESYPVVGRLLSHAEGRGLQLFNNYNEARQSGHHYYTKVIPSVAEYRVWVFRDQLLGCYLREQTWPVLEPQTFARTWQSGWGFTYQPVSGSVVTLGRLASRAVRCLGLDFGGVDIIRTSEGVDYVLEVNTCPGANGYCQHALNQLAQQVKEWFDGLR